MTVVKQSDIGILISINVLCATIPYSSLIMVPCPPIILCRTTYSTCTCTRNHVVIVDVAFLHNASLQPHFTFDDPQHTEMKHSHKKLLAMEFDSI